MYYFITELQTRPDGIVNTSIITRSSLALGLSYYYQRASVAVSTVDFKAVALTLQDQNGVIIENKCFDTCYEEPVAS